MQRQKSGQHKEMGRARRLPEWDRVNESKELAVGCTSRQHNRERDHHECSRMHQSPAWWRLWSPSVSHNAPAASTARDVIATTVSPQDSGEYPLFMSGHHSRTMHVRKQRWIIPRGRGAIFIRWMPLRFCNQIAVIQHWEEQIAQQPQQVGCTLKVEPLLTQVGCKSQHQPTAVRLVDPKLPALFMQMRTRWLG